MGIDAKRIMEGIEREWLGVVRPAPQLVIARAGLPEERAGVDYCGRCGDSVGTGEASSAGCAGCFRSRVPWGRIVRVGRYEDLLREWIHDVKFDRDLAMGLALGRLLGSRLQACGITADFIVPVPGSLWRRVMRGSDHTAGIAWGVARQTGALLVHALSRRHRPVQRAVAPSARRKNVRGMFRRGWGLGLPQAARVVVVDDIVTSRSTMIEAVRALRSLYGLRRDSVTAATVAVADAMSRRKRAEASVGSANVDP